MNDLYVLCILCKYCYVVSCQSDLQGRVSQLEGCGVCACSVVSCQTGGVSPSWRAAVCVPAVWSAVRLGAHLPAGGLRCVCLQCGQLSDWGRVSQLEGCGVCACSVVSCQTGGVSPSWRTAVCVPAVWSAVRLGPRLPAGGLRCVCLPCGQLSDWGRVSQLEGCGVCACRVVSCQTGGASPSWRAAVCVPAVWSAVGLGACLPAGGLRCVCLQCGQLSDWGRVSQLEGCSVCACRVVSCQTGGESPSWRAAVCVPAVWSAVRLGPCLPAGGLRCVCLPCGQLSDWGRVSQLEGCGVCACSVVSCQTGGASPSWRAAVCVPAVWSAVRLGPCLPAGGLRCVCLQCGQLSDWGRVSQLEGCGVCACSVVSCQTGGESPSWRAAVCVPAVWSAVRLGPCLPAGGLRCVCLQCGQLSDWGCVSQLEGCGVCACSVVSCQTGGASPSWRSAVCVPAVWSAVRLGARLPAGGLRCVCLQCGQLSDWGRVSQLEGCGVCLQCGQLSDWGRVSQLEGCGVCACSVVSCQTGAMSPSWRAAVCVPAVWSAVRLGARLPAGGLRCVCLQCGQLSDWGRVSQLESCGVCACSVVSCQTGAVSPSWRAAVCVPAVWSAVRLGVRLPAGGLRCVCLQCGQLSDWGCVSQLEVCGVCACSVVSCQTGGASPSWRAAVCVPAVWSAVRLGPCLPAGGLRCVPAVWSAVRLGPCLPAGGLRCVCLQSGQLSDWGRVSQLEVCGVCACSVVSCQTGGASPSWRAAVCVPAVWSAVRLGVRLPAGGLRCVCLQCGQLSDWGRISQLEDCGVCACSLVSCQTGGASPSWRAAVCVPAVWSAVRLGAHLPAGGLRCVPAVWSAVRLGAHLPAGGLRCVCLQCGQLSDWGRVSQLEDCGVCACSLVSCQTGGVSPSWRSAVCVPAVWSAVRLGACLPAGGLRCVCLQCGQLSDLRGRVSALEDALAAVESTARQQLCALASQSEAAIDTAQEKLLYASSALRQFNKFVGVSVGSAWGHCRVSSAI